MANVFSVNQRVTTGATIDDPRGVTVGCWFIEESEIDEEFGPEFSGLWFRNRADAETVCRAANEGVDCLAAVNKMMRQSRDVFRLRLDRGPTANIMASYGLSIDNC